MRFPLKKKFYDFKKKKNVEIVGAHSTSGKATRMWRGTLSEALPPGKDLKPRVIIPMASFNFFDPSPWPTISVQNPPTLWSDNDLDGNIWHGWRPGMDLITWWAFAKWYKKHLVDQASLNTLFFSCPSGLKVHGESANSPFSYYPWASSICRSSGMFWVSSLTASVL